MTFLQFVIVCIGVALGMHLATMKALAGPTTQTRQTSNISLGSPTAPRQPVAQPAKSAAQQPGSQPVATSRTDAATTAVDTGHAVVGGRVYSTGADDVILKVLTPAELPYPPEVIDTRINGVRVLLPNPNVSAYVDEIAIAAPSPARVIATNKQYDRTVNLGRLPAGEIIFAIRTPDNFFKTGEGSRNTDGRPHAIVKTFLSGVMQVWFEDQAGTGVPNDWDCNDAVFQLSGGVADNNAVAELTKVIKGQQGEPRQQAIEALKQINPKALLLALQP